MVSLSPVQSGPFYIGGSITLQCQASISSLVDTPVSPTFTWKKQSGVVLTNTDRLTITTNPSTYQSTLTITRLSSGLDADEPYLCEVTVGPTTPSPLIMPSLPSVSTPYTLTLTCKLSLQVLL